MAVNLDLLAIIEADERAQQDVAAVRARLAAERRAAEEAAVSSREAAALAAEQDLEAAVAAIGEQAARRRAERRHHRDMEQEKRRSAAEKCVAAGVAAFVAIVRGDMFDNSIDALVRRTEVVWRATLARVFHEASTTEPIAAASAPENLP